MFPKHRLSRVILASSLCVSCSGFFSPIALGQVSAKSAASAQLDSDSATAKARSSNYAMPLDINEEGMSAGEASGASSDTAANSVDAAGRKSLIIQDQVDEPYPTTANESQATGNDENTVPLRSSLKAIHTISPAYKLGPNDVISIQVFNNPNLDHESIRVQPDGYIIVDFLGPVYVARKTVQELHALLVEKYSIILKDPRVTLNLVETKPFIVYITGAVLTPGAFELQTTPGHQMTMQATRLEVNLDRRSPLLSNVLVASGGVMPDADMEHIKVENKETGEVREVDLIALLKDGSTEQDVYLEPGDTIKVPHLLSPLAQAETNYRLYANSTFAPKVVPVKVYGFVNTPGVVQLPTSMSLNLSSAIMSAGGFYREAAYAPRKVYLFRPDNNGKLVLRGSYNPMKEDPQIMANDIVYVPDKPRPNIIKVFDYVTRMSAPFAVNASTYRNLTGKYIFNSGVNFPSN